MRAFLIAIALLFSFGASAQPWPGPPRATFNGTFTGPATLLNTNTLCSEALALRFSSDADTGLQRAAADTLVICANGAAIATFDGTATTGDVTLSAVDDVFFTIGGGGFQFAASTSRAWLANSASSAMAIGLDVSGGPVSAGPKNTVNANIATLCGAEGVSGPGSATNLGCFYGGGGFGIPSTGQQAITIASDGAGTTPTDTTSPTSAHIEVTCNDPNNCNYNPGETSVVDGWKTDICNVGTANSVIINDTNDAVAVSGAASITLTAATAASSGGDCTSCVYTGDRWSCRQ